MAYIDGRGTWELNVYDEIADAKKYAAEQRKDSLGCSLDRS